MVLILMDPFNKNDYHYHKLVSQTIDILIYDYHNKYQSLKQNNFAINDIDKYMDEYQTTRTNQFILDIKRISNIYKK